MGLIVTGGREWSGGKEWQGSHDLRQFGSAFVMSLGHQLDVSTYSSSSGIELLLISLTDRQSDDILGFDDCLECLLRSGSGLEEAGGSLAW